MHYAQVKVSVKPEIAAAFKAACAEQGVSQAQVLSAFMADFSKKPKTEPPTTRLDSRKRRRAAVQRIAELLGAILYAEENYFVSVPDNLHGSKWHEASEASISILQEIIDNLGDIYV